MPIDLSGLVLIIGNYGSGKTEVSLNLAVRSAEQGNRTSIADLDIVNPYFRTREAREILMEKGIEVVTPAPMYKDADLPILVPRVSGLIGQATQGLALLDVGGDDAGAKVLRTLADAFRGVEYQMLQVVNHLRPFTDTVEGCANIRRSIEASCGMTVTGIIGNSHLMEETTAQTILDGYDFAREVARDGNLELEFITADETLLTEIDREAVGCEILPLKRMLLPPWAHGEKLGPKQFLLH